jgi:hypothetical protein
MVRAALDPAICYGVQSGQRRNFALRKNCRLARIAQTGGKIRGEFHEPP